jgi:hypothetical protein
MTLPTDARPEEEARNARWWRPVRAAATACLHLTLHAIVLLYLILLFYWGERLLAYLGQPHELKFFDSLPVRYIVDGIDILLFVVFAVRGTWTAFKVFGEEGE